MRWKHLLAPFISVITSYSIHYTKLYEPRRTSVVRAEDRGAADDPSPRPAVRVGGALRRLPRDLVVVDEGVHRLGLGRITSYNVCYTKLLRVFACAVERREALAAELGPGFGIRLPIVATGHLTTVGASASESVREIYVGALEAFPTAAFPPADYIALGHIHRPQKVGGLEHIRYCGSPLPLGFDA